MDFGRAGGRRGKQNFAIIPRFCADFHIENDPLWPACKLILLTLRGQSYLIGYQVVPPPRHSQTVPCLGTEFVQAEVVPVQLYRSPTPHLEPVGALAPTNHVGALVLMLVVNRE